MGLDVLGTGIAYVPATRTRKAGGPKYLDVVRAVTLFYLPVYSLGASHRSMDQFLWLSDEVVPLQSTRVVSKGFLNRWGSGLLMVGFILLMMVTGRHNQVGVVPWGLVWVALSIGSVGLMLDVVWRVLERHDQRIRDVLGIVGQGISDPRDWPDAVADQWTETLVAEGHSLVSTAESLRAEGRYTQAMLCIRLAMRDRTKDEAAEVCEQLLREAPVARFMTK